METENKKRHAVVSRSEGERIVLSDDIVIRVYRIDGPRKRALIYVQTPCDIEIKRPSTEEDAMDRQSYKNKLSKKGKK